MRVPRMITCHMIVSIMGTGNRVEVGGAKGTGILFAQVKVNVCKKLGKRKKVTVPFTPER